MGRIIVYYEPKGRQYAQENDEVGNLMPCLNYIVTQPHDSEPRNFSECTCMLCDGCYDDPLSGSLSGHFH